MENPNGVRPARACVRPHHITPENITRLGEQTRHRGLCSPDVEETREPWCADLSACPALDAFGIRHMGIVDAAADYCFQRTQSRQSVFLACLRGTGYAGTAPTISLLSGGHGVLLPSGCPNTYFNASEHEWQLVWICFEQSASPVSGVDAASFPLDAEVFLHTLEALITCWDRYGNLAVVHRMTEGLMDLVGLHLRIRPELQGFHDTWRAVTADLGADWDAARIATLGGCSQERFRQLCWSTFGTSPMKHLTGLRLHRARHVLSTTTLTIEEISGKFGYSDAYAFSHAFKRRFGMSPRAFRSRDTSARGESVSTG